jgi:glycosyltransferase involved in cell wall biosynthesis
VGIQTVLVCEAQVPFVHGGAEVHARELVRELKARGYESELVSVPFKWYPKEEILPHAAAWRLLDLSESNGRPVDAVIATKFPTYFVRHPRKVAWLLHQYRAAYELCDTAFSDFTHTESDVALRERLIGLDTRMLAECRHICTIARNISARLQKFNALPSVPLYPPPRLGPRLEPGPYGDFVLSVGRIESVKRVDLLVRAMASVAAPIRLMIAGVGSQSENVRREAERAGVADRVTFLGAVSDEELLNLYSNALCVAYPPYDEDYGYVTLEAFLSRKPVVTCVDSGGPNEFVVDGESGFSCEPDAGAIASAINTLAANRRMAAAMGDAGYAAASNVTWDGVIEALLA